MHGFVHAAGKTTILRNLLTQEKYKIGCVVNDVAAVNIDAKLIRNQNNTNEAKSSTSDLAPTIELQNGCACALLHCCMTRCTAPTLPLLQHGALCIFLPCCKQQSQTLTFLPAGCSIQDELFASFEQILGLADKNGVKYDRIVLENSGVAEPQNIRDAFAAAAEEGHPVLKRAHLSTLVRPPLLHTAAGAAATRLHRHALPALALCYRRPPCLQGTRLYSLVHEPDISAACIGSRCVATCKTSFMCRSRWSTAAPSSESTRAATPWLRGRTSAATTATSAPSSTSSSSRRALLNTSSSSRSVVSAVCCPTTSTTPSAPPLSRRVSALVISELLFAAHTPFAYLPPL